MNETYNLIMFLLGVACTAFIADKVYTMLKIHSPTRKVGKLILEGNRLILSVNESSRIGTFDTYICHIVDVETGAETKVAISNNLHTETGYLDGDLDWMNVYEQAYIADIATKIIRGKARIQESEDKASATLSNSERREEAKERYN